LNANRVDNSKAYPKSGTTQLEFNKTGTLLLARFGKKKHMLAEEHLKPTDVQSNKSRECADSRAFVCISWTRRGLLATLAQRIVAYIGSDTRTLESSASRKVCTKLQWSGNVSLERRMDRGRWC